MKIGWSTRQVHMLILNTIWVYEILHSSSLYDVVQYNAVIKACLEAMNFAFKSGGPCMLGKKLYLQRHFMMYRVIGVLESNLYPLLMWRRSP